VAIILQERGFKFEESENQGGLSEGLTGLAPNVYTGNPNEVLPNEVLYRWAAFLGFAGPRSYLDGLDSEGPDILKRLPKSTGDPPA